MKNANLNNAKKNPNDELYTTYEDISMELSGYKGFFNNKIIYLNADDLNSNFTKFFINNFDNYNLKELLISGFDKTTGEGINAIINNNNKKEYNADGDFQNNITFLEKGDIVITNPPFSLMRRWIDLMNLYNKKYIFIAPLTILKYPPVFDLIVEGKFSIGYDQRLGLYFVDKKGNKAHISATWFTNLPIIRNTPFITFTQKFNPSTAVYYDNAFYNGNKILYVENYLQIPSDYYGVISVPITFLNRMNRKQFKVLGSINGYITDKYNIGSKRTINGHEIYTRMLIQRIR